VVKSLFSEIDLKEVVDYNLVVRSDYSEWWCGENRADPGSKWSCRQSDERSFRLQCWRFYGQDPTLVHVKNRQRAV